MSRIAPLAVGALVALTTLSVEAVAPLMNDLNVLNYALTLEHLEAAYYSRGQSMFTAAQFAAAGFGGTVYEDLGLIAQEEAVHVEAITSVIQQLGGNPVMPCTYNFSAIMTVPDYLMYAAVFEGVGVTAYDGALSSITTPLLQQVAAQIAVIEARHTGYVRYIQNLLPFPLAFDNATAPLIIGGEVAPFFESCPAPAAATATWPLPNGLPGIALPMIRSNTTGYSAPANATASDLLTVNYAITYENLEMTFYSMIIDMYNSTDFVNAGFAANTYDWLSLILRNEQTHVQVLQTVGLLLGNTAPLPVCQYKFPNITSPAMAINYMALVCGTGAAAFTGAADTISNPIIQQSAATIATVEGRQVAFLESLVGINPVAYSFQRAYNTSTVVEFASQFLVGCPYPVKGPMQPAGVTSDAYSTDPSQMTNLTAPFSSLKHSRVFKQLKA